MPTPDDKPATLKSLAADLEVLRAELLTIRGSDAARVQELEGRLGRLEEQLGELGAQLRAELRPVLESLTSTLSAEIRSELAERKAEVPAGQLEDGELADLRRVLTWFRKVNG